MGYCMPQDGYGSVSAPEDKIEQASEYKPAGATWGEVLVAGAERLNDGLDSDTGEPDGVPIHVPKANYDRAETIKERYGDTWGGVVMYYATHRGSLDARTEAGSLPDDLREQLDRIESAATTAEARTGRIEGTLEDMGAGR